MAQTEINAPSGKQEIMITRRYNAPREQVYKIMTDPKLVPEWWGPRNLTTEIEKMEMRPGGQWRFIQHDKQGNIFAFHGIYHAVKAPKLLIYTMEWEGLPEHVLTIYERLEEQDGVTICNSRFVFETVEDRDGMLEQGMESGNTEITERIDELLRRIGMGGTKPEKGMVHNKDNKSIKITRVFNAPRDKVWQRWTDPNQYTCWWGPKDFTSPYAKIDLRVGGKYLNCMRGTDGKEYWSTGVYKEIVEPIRFVCTDSFADEYGNVVPATYYGFGADFPMELEVEVTLEDLGNQTRMTLEHCGLPEGEIQEQTKQSWNESFDKLEECIR